MYGKKRIQKKHIQPIFQQHVYEFYNAYEDQFSINSTYELEDEYIQINHIEKRVYKYYPFPLPYKFIGTNVYSYIRKDEWIKIGMLSESEVEQINSYHGKLLLYQGDCKDVEEDYVEIIEEEPYFCFLIKTDRDKIITEKIHLTL